MKNIFLGFLIALTGCASLSSSKSERHQMELNMHKVRTELEDLKHDLNTCEIEYHVLEGKLTDQEQMLASLRKQINELKVNNLDSFPQKLQVFEKSLQQFAKKQDKIISDIRQLSSHANDTTIALSQYKDKMAQFEKVIASQNQQVNEFVKLKENIAKLTQLETKMYVVKSGDSLEKIAREHGTSVEELKKINHMSSDLIVVDQTLNLP